jgi:uncharacterized protein (TIGR03435 family)
MKFAVEQVGADLEAERVGDPPSLFTAIREQLGLQLVASRAAVEVIVIDHIEHSSSS